MSGPGVQTLLVAGYAVFLLVVAHAFDRMAQRVSRRSARWRNGSFVYHDDHDAWLCPQDQWLWPTTYDPHQRTMRYRASPVVCNACPVKDTCTTSNTGREVTREIDPWPHSEAGRFHRGISCSIAALAVLAPAVVLATSARHVADVVVLLAALLVTTVGSVPLARHLWRTPTGFPEHVPHMDGPSVEALIDRYSTRWGVGATSTSPPPKEGSS